MRKSLPLIAAFVLLASVIRAQTGCDGSRYVSEVFPSLDVTTDIPYGSNINLQGQTETLQLDVYEPQGDTLSARPLIVWVHGGNFLGGAKDEPDVKPLSETFARMGYVTASINYRVGVAGVPFPGPSSDDIRESVLRAVHDSKAAVRFFKKDAAGSNTYRIDPNKVFLGGVSAGAVTALHYAYLDQLSELPAGIDTSAAGLGGGMEGNSGNPGFSDDIAGVINIAGALDEDEWLVAGDEPLVSLHGSNDATVPYGTGQLTFLGIFQLMEVDGSATIAQRADNQGVDNCFFPYVGADHVPHVGNAAYTDTTVQIVKNFLSHLVCGGPSQCNTVLSVDAAPVNVAVTAYPQPADQAVHVAWPQAPAGDWNWEMFDLQGRIVQTGIANGIQTTINRAGWPSGMYMLRMRASQMQASQKIHFQ